VAAGAVGLPVAFVALLVVEAQIAGGGPKLAEQPFAVDGRWDRERCGRDAPAVPLWFDGRVPVTDAGSGRARVDPLRVAWLGDSTAAGVGATRVEETLPVQVACGLGRPVELRSFAVSGARLDQVVGSQLPALLALPPEELPHVVIVDVGANDVTHLTRVNAFRSSYLGLLDQLKGKAAVIALGVPDLGSATRLAQPLRFVAGVRGGTYDAAVEAMRDQGADYVNIADFTGPRFREDPDRYFAADHYHPNGEGYGLWAATVLPVLAWRVYKMEHPDRPEPLMPKEAKGTVKGEAP
jgi:lysophospholipase L1-like esterase